MASGTISLGTSGAMTGQIVWSSTANGTAANNSTVTATLQVKRTNSYTTTGTFSYFFGVGGKSANSSWYGSISSNWVTIATLSDTVSHNANGSGSCYIVGKINGPSGTSLSGNTVSNDQTVTLDTIPRQASITSASNFNDEQNPTITYSNPAGNSVTSLQTCISWTGNADIEYRDISKTGTSYTFNFTNAEREKLRKAATGNTLAVTFYVKTVISGNTYYSTLKKTLTIINANPTLSPTVIDSNTTITALTGDNSKFVKGYSNANYAINATALKSATLKSQSVVCGEKTSTTATGTLNAVESGTFVFTVKDSRGNATSKTLTKTLINYVKLTCDLNASMPKLNADGKTATTTLKITGNYFNGTFGKVNNSLTIKWRIKENENAYGEWVNITPVINGNTYEATLNIADLNYQSIYALQAVATDALIKNKTTPEIKINTIPVYDWGANDFKFNVDVYDKNGAKLGSEIIAENQAAVAVSGNILQETGFVSITPVANTPTSAAVKFKKTYKKIPTIVMSVASGVPGTQVLGYGQTGISTTGVNIVVTRTNTTPTILYYYVFGEVAD